MENATEAWQVEANGKVFDTNLAEVCTWINEGALLRMDRVRKGNLRWIEAGKVPTLIAFFNAKENGTPLSPVVSTTDPGVFGNSQPTAENPPNYVPDNSQTGFTDPIAEAPAEAEFFHQPLPADVCSMHNDLPAAYFCGTCSNSFCKTCPTSFGTKVKICPFCGAMCTTVAQAEKEQERERVYHSAVGQGFGFGDFGNALAYPFKFKTSLIFGAIMFMFFSIGQSVTAIGGIFMLSSAIFCFMLANMLTFGILGNTVENFAQGKLGENFMPSFDEFSLWDDVVHPFFLSIGVYISSFGPLVAVFLLAFFMILSPVRNEMNAVQTDAARMTNPDLNYASKAADQTKKVKELINNQQEAQKRRIAAIESGDIEPDEVLPKNTAVKETEEEDFERMNQMIQQSRKAQLESAIGKTPETVAKERGEFVKNILAYGILFIILAGLSLVWGLFYFPAACAVAGYTRSFMATLNPLVGLDTIRRLGVDYFKILLMGLLIILVSGFIGGVLSVALSPFDLPGMGNIPARAIGSLFSFYFWIVFSCVIGFALFKRADKLELIQL